jgi:hypothetical protein
MPQVGFETMIPVFERAKTIHALERAASEVGLHCIYSSINPKVQWSVIYIVIDFYCLKICVHSSRSVRRSIFVIFNTHEYYLRVRVYKTT